MGRMEPFGGLADSEVRLKMSSYLSLNIRLGTDRLPQAMCAVIASQSCFRLASIGGIEGHESGDNWFLCGYALEDFIRRFHRPLGANPASIETVPAPDGSNREYLSQAAAEIRTGMAVTVLSPFEKSSVELSATFLDEHEIGPTEIARCGDWVQTFTSAILYFYGAVHLAPRSSKVPGVVWQRAFREISASGEIDAPFVLVRVGTAPLATGSVDVLFRTQSRVWVDVDANLRNFVAIVASVVKAAGELFIAASLDLDGHPFLGDERRLRSAFADGLGREVGRNY